MQIRKILITHFHGDHFLGIPGLIQSMFLNERSEPLEIIGPKGTIPIIRTLMTLGFYNPTFDLILREMNDGEIIEYGYYDLRAVKVDHGVPTLGYAFEEHQRPGRFNKPRALELGVPEGPLFSKIQRGEAVEVNGKRITPDMILGPPRPGRKIVYSGDTRPSERIIALAKDADVLIHDATSDSSLREKINAYGHSTAAQAAEIASAAKVKQLFLTHISPRYYETTTLEQEAKAIFPNTVVAKDFLEYEVKLEK